MEDRYLTENFTLYDLTKTNRAQFQQKNREVTDDQIMKLIEVARLLEHVVFVLGVPVNVTSGYRCPDLNKAIGSSDRSQHLLCEAVDFIPEKMDLGEAFRKLWKDVKDNGTNVGQLIFETADRGYDEVSWLHISLGTPYRDEKKCAQILRMNDSKYELLA